MLLNYITELLKTNKEHAYNKLFSNMGDSYEQKVKTHTDETMSILYKNRDEMIKSMPNTFIVGDRNDIDDYENKRDENTYFNMEKMVEYGLSYYYIKFAQEATEQGFTSEPFTIMNGQNLEEQFQASLTDPHNKMLLVHKYMGMGHYLGLAVFKDQLDDDFDKKIYFIEHLGGSNGWEQEDSWNKYQALCPTDVQNKLCTFREAIQELVNFKVEW